MQAIVETLFDAVYLISVITIGILMIRKSKGNRQFTMFGIMAVLLGSGDAFHRSKDTMQLQQRSIYSQD